MLCGEGRPKRELGFQQKLPRKDDACWPLMSLTETAWEYFEMDSSTLGLFFAGPALHMQRMKPILVRNHGRSFKIHISVIQYG